MKPEEAILQTQWCLQEAYKIAVHHLGITDWSREPHERKTQCEVFQCEVAKMIQKALHS